MASAALKAVIRPPVHEAEIVDGILTIIDIAVRFFFLILACGWAFGRILKTAKAAVSPSFEGHARV